MAADKKYADIVTAEIVGDTELLQFIKEMDTVISNKIVLAALKKGGEIINQQAKSNFMSRKRNKSKTGYAGFNSLFKVQPIKSPEKIGVKVGMSGKEGYKYRWIQWGTNERYSIKRNKENTKGKKLYTGKIQATNFFYGAVATQAEKANAMVSESIIDALKKMKEDANNKSA
jgi:hypothetical protein